METTNTRNLVKKLSLIMAALGPLPRTGEKRGQTRGGSEFSYPVFEEADILQPVQRELAGHGVVIVPKCLAIDYHVVEGKQGDVPKTTVFTLVEYQICDAESCERLVGQMPGAAEERGDGTGLSKALTDSNKNFLRKLFELSAYEPQQGRRPTSKAVQQTAPTQPAPSGTISVQQQKRMFALATEHHVEHDRLKDFLFQRFNYVSSKDVHCKDYEQICGWVEGGGK